MADPLFTPAEAHARARELIKLFDDDPDTLSPDEQALVIEILRLESDQEERARIRHNQ